MQQVDVEECVELKQNNMRHVCMRRWASGSAVILFQTLTISWTGETPVLPIPFVLMNSAKHLITTAHVQHDLYYGCIPKITSAKVIKLKVNLCLVS